MLSRGANRGCPPLMAHFTTLAIVPTDTYEVTTIVGQWGGGGGDERGGGVVR